MSKIKIKREDFALTVGAYATALDVQEMIRL